MALTQGFTYQSAMMGYSNTMSLGSLSPMQTHHENMLMAQRLAMNAQSQSYGVLPAVKKSPETAAEILQEKTDEWLQNIKLDIGV